MVDDLSFRTNIGTKKGKVIGSLRFGHKFEKLETVKNGWIKIRTEYNKILREGYISRFFNGNSTYEVLD